VGEARERAVDFLERFMTTVRGMDIGERTVEESWPSYVDELAAALRSPEPVEPSITQVRTLAKALLVGRSREAFTPAEWSAMWTLTGGAPAPAGEPVDVLGQAIMDLANEAEILRTQHVDNLRALDSGRRIQKIVDVLVRLRSGGP
jgi:hypothetical protein